MKKFVSVLLIAAMLVSGALLTGCSKKVEDFDFANTDLSTYVKLGDYKSLTVEITEVAEVTDAAVEADIQSFLEGYATTEIIDSGVVADGDVLTIDYSGIVEGETEPRDGTQATGATLTIGSKQFIDGFESGLIGVEYTAENPGKKTLNLTFPENYTTNPELSGKNIVFDVTVHSSEKSVTPTLTDEFLTTNETGYTTVAEYRESVRKALTDTHDATLKKEQFAGLWKAICEKAEVLTYPEAYLNKQVNAYLDNYSNQAAYNELTLKDFLGKYYAMTVEDFKAEITEELKTMIKEEMVYNAIIDAEGTTLTDEEYTAGCETYLGILTYVDSDNKSQKYADVDSMVAGFGEAKLRDLLTWEKTITALIADNTFTQVPAAE